MRTMIALDDELVTKAQAPPGTKDQLQASKSGFGRILSSAFILQRFS